MYHYDFTCVPYTNSLLICLLKPNAQTRAQPLAIYPLIGLCICPSRRANTQRNVYTSLCDADMIILLL